LILLAITSDSIFNYREASFDELIKHSAELAIKNDYERKATLYCLTHSFLSQDEKDDSIEELAEIYVSTFLNRLTYYINRLHKYESELQYLKENAPTLKMEHINFLKNKFNEWDKNLETSNK
jgi:hypothetical protein